MSADFHPPPNAKPEETTAATKKLQIKKLLALHYMERDVDLLRDRVAALGLDCDDEHFGFLRVATSYPVVPIQVFEQ